MSDSVSGKWYPYNPDGTPHNCRNQTQTSRSTGTKKVMTKTLSLEELDARIKRLEGLVIGAQK